METNDVQSASSLKTFYNNNWGFVYTIHQLLVISPCQEFFLVVGTQS